MPLHFAPVHGRARDERRISAVEPLTCDNPDTCPIASWAQSPAMLAIGMG
jgi:hypothetical protein